MARSLGLTAYRALARRGEVGDTTPSAPRPEGELLWIHAPEADGMGAVLALAARICNNRAGLSVLITETKVSTARPASSQPDQTLFFDEVPGEHPQAVKAFLDHWQPDVCIWVWGGLRPNLLEETGNRGCPLLLIDADPMGFDGRRDRWLPDVSGELLKRFSHVFARSDAGRRRLMQMGLRAADIVQTAALVPDGQALPCVDSDLTELSAALGGRPVWFAAQVQPAEVPLVLAAHRQAIRLSHRLLLILSVARPEEAAEARRKAMEDGFDTVQWEDTGPPDETRQVMVVEDARDRGLFFRVAPVSFLGSSLLTDEDGCDPFEAAALGSAILYGPKVRRYLSSYSRLAAVGAARIVNDANALGNAVSRLIAPDQAATMAHAGWDVVSQGAELTDKLTELVQDALDQRISRK